MKKYVLLVVSAVVVGVVAGLVIVAQQDDGGATTAAVNPTPDPGRHAGSPNGSSSSGDTVPDLVGAPLDEAEDRLDGLGIDHEATGGGLFGIVIRSAWEVCETRPSAGSPARAVELIVERPGQC